MAAENSVEQYTAFLDRQLYDFYMHLLDTYTNRYFSTQFKPGIQMPPQDFITAFATKYPSMAAEFTTSIDSNGVIIAIRINHS